MTDFNLVRPEEIKFIGIDNYVQMASDPNVAQALLVDLQVRDHRDPPHDGRQPRPRRAVNSPKLFGRNIFRTLLYMPIQIPLVASTLVWIGFLNTETGWLNGIIESVGLPGPDWINSEVWIYPALALIGLWGVGNFMLINIAGMQSVPTELYEAAKIDGAGAWKSFRRITIPLMSPILLYNLVISLIVTFQYFTQAYTMTNGRGDPNNATLFINLDLFREAFVFNRMGYGGGHRLAAVRHRAGPDGRALRLRPQARLLRRGRGMTTRRVTRRMRRSATVDRSRGPTGATSARRA